MLTQSFLRLFCTKNLWLLRQKLLKIKFCYNKCCIFWIGYVNKKWVQEAGKVWPQILMLSWDQNMTPGINFNSHNEIFVHSFYLFSMLLFSSDATIFSKVLIYFLSMKSKKGPQKLLLICPNFFYSTARLPKPAQN